RLAVLSWPREQRVTVRDEGVRGARSGGDRLLDGLVARGTVAAALRELAAGGPDVAVVRIHFQRGVEERPRFLRREGAAQELAEDQERRVAGDGSRIADDVHVLLGGRVFDH